MPTGERRRTWNTVARKPKRTDFFLSFFFQYFVEARNFTSSYLTICVIYLLIDDLYVIRQNNE